MSREPTAVTEPGRPREMDEGPALPGAEPPLPGPAPAPVDEGAAEPGAPLPGAPAVPAILGEETARVPAIPGE